MKITTTYLRQVIKEELEKALEENIMPRVYNPGYKKGKGLTKVDYQKAFIKELASELEKRGGKDERR